MPLFIIAQNWKNTNIPPSEMDKQTMAYPYSGILLKILHKKEGIFDTWNEMTEMTESQMLSERRNKT